MSVMLRQSVSEPKKPFSRIIFFIFSMVIILNISIELTNYLSAKIAMISSIGILMSAISGSYYLVKRKIPRYTYSIINDELIINREIGNSECTLLNIKVNRIESIKPIEELRFEEKCYRIQNLSCRLKRLKRYYGQYRVDNKVYRFVFQPNERIYDEIFRKLNENNY